MGMPESRVYNIWTPASASASCVALPPASMQSFAGVTREKLNSICKLGKKARHSGSRKARHSGARRNPVA